MSIDYEKYGPTLDRDGRIVARIPSEKLREEMAEVMAEVTGEPVALDGGVFPTDELDELVERLCAKGACVARAVPAWARAGIE